ncbi:hypothetical protein SteCoe_35752 [Stentor coeruleus]|uniref:Uncharacterized protein n=1 Tax=Stentor coeruleus TaxID=5963 RepID=A0A1R2ARK8_9CILI|nr:hypothetical protein SteCoe_35752 [Stentor coeruleus]
MGCSVSKPKVQSIRTLRQGVETTSSDTSKAKQLQFYDIIQAKEQVNKKKIINAPILDLSKSQLFQRRNIKAKQEPVSVPALNLILISGEL